MVAPRACMARMAGPSHERLDDTYVYWADMTTVGTIMKAPKAGGGTATVLARDTNPTAIAVDANSVYWGDQGGYIKPYIACNSLAANVPGGHEFPIPAGLACGDGLDCMTGETCNATGECLGGAPIADCGAGDASAGTLGGKETGDGDTSNDAGPEAHSRDAGSEASDTTDSGRAESSGSGGCSMTRLGERPSEVGFAGLLPVAAATCRRRRGSRPPQR
jgi:hypothetical protein